MTYSEVVEKAKIEVSDRTDYGTKKVSLKPCVTWLNGNQINLWTYWQGYQIKDIDKGVDILLVGQDWGNPNSEANEETINRINAMQKGEDISYLAEGPTDRTLKELFEFFDCDISSKDPGLRLFFTNYSLGYRNGPESGGMTKGLLLKDKELFEDLVEAIKPTIIICLGKLTYEVVSESIAKDYIKRLSDGIPFKSPYPKNKSIIVYGVPHCGARGQSNIRGKEPMKKIWKAIAEEYKDLAKD